MLQPVASIWCHRGAETAYLFTGRAYEIVEIVSWAQEPVIRLPKASPKTLLLGCAKSAGYEVLW